MSSQPPGKHTGIRTGQRVRDFAVKSPIQSGDPYFEAEKSWMDTFATAEHFVQPFWSLCDNPYGGSENAQILKMEYFERFELQELLIRVNESVSNNAMVPDNEKKLEYIPSRVLWRLFLCLARACIGLAYPPPYHHGRPDTYREVIIPDLEPELNIHFDMHPFNVFIADPDSTRNDIPEHGFVPRFKLGDFGLTQAWDPNLDDETKIVVANVGKPGYQAPEQLRRDRILEDNAFGPHTNIWGAGWLMYNALTLYFTSDEDWQPQVCPITMPDGTTKNLNTWAPFLVGHDARVYEDFRSYSVQLRTLIARCMADRQEDRPSLQELLDIIQANIASGDAAAANKRMQFEAARQVDPSIRIPPVNIKRPPPVEDDNLLQRFFREYLREPPLREDPYRDYWDQ
ncbi:kinase-like domain-containing protein [Hypoxylon sp. FL1150]|nr:kinase-like domain-containing protein [Hypoxylon sp. FL1150]